ncbi:MAG: diguanylate cyclase [Pseudomonadota bacterium]
MALRFARQLAIAAAAALIALTCGCALAAQPPAVLSANTGSLSLTPHLVHRHDTTGKDRVEDAWRRLERGEFEPVPAGKTTFGFRPGALWFHARLINRNRDEPYWMLVQGFALIDRIDLYLRYPDGRIEHRIGGDMLPFSERSIPYRQPNFRVVLPPDQPVEMLVRIESQSSLQVPLDLHTPDAFTSLSRDSQFAMGLYYGILLALFVYNVALWATLRESAYFWYLFHISAFGLVLFTFNGYSFEYLWPDNPWLANLAAPASICLATVGMQQFARTFLGLHRRFPFGNRISLAFIAFFSALGIASLWIPYSLSISVASRVELASVLWLVIAAFVTMRRGYAPARLFLLAWSMLLLGTILFALLAFGVVPKNLLTEYGLQIGSALEMLMLSMALSYRYSILRSENARIVGEANQQLERKVAQRTQEAVGALTQLEDAHRRLRDSSRRDGLTGLYNRAHFHERFEELLRDGRERGHPVSLLMIDLDHFKSINDRYGHLVGDDCLRWAAHRIGQALRTHDSSLLARFGGEEFVAVLPGHGLQEAVDVAESLRRRLVDEPCVSGEHRLRVSASIGVHTVDADTDADSDAALSVADKALYSAKANGRDCVRTSITAA